MATLSGGKKLEAALSAISDNVGKASTVSIGFLSDATYPDGKSVAMVAAIQEFGAPSRGIPPRPFFRGLINAKSGEWPDAVAGLLKANDYDAEKTLTLTGAAIAGQLQEAITQFSGAPLAESTVKKKGSSKQLVDTGVMLAAVNFEVK